MKLSRISLLGAPRLVLTHDGKTRLLPQSVCLSDILRQSDTSAYLSELVGDGFSLGGSALLPPIEDQEVWGCGVTYERSRSARVAESVGASALYEQVYLANRPLLFPKGRGSRMIGHGQRIHLKRDSKSIVPEPEMVLVCNSSANIIGVCIGNDLTCRDIEAENPLYQPQAKIWNTSGILGPHIEIVENFETLIGRSIKLDWVRQGKIFFSGESNTARIIRPLRLLVDILFQDRSFPEGVYLFTGTGIVPPDATTLVSGDEIRIALQGVGELHNSCAVNSE